MCISIHTYIYIFMCRIQLLLSPLYKKELCQRDEPTCLWSLCMNGRIRRWGHGRRTQAVWPTKKSADSRKSADSEDSYVAKYKTCRPQGLPREAGRSRRSHSQKTEIRGRGWKGWGQSYWASTWPHTPCSFHYLVTQRQNLLEFPSYSTGWGH